MNHKSNEYLHRLTFRMDETKHNEIQKTLPFDNLYLASGLVNGQNKAWMYFFTIMLTIFGYLSFQLIVLYPLATRLQENGYSEREITENAALLFDSNALGIDRNVVLLLELGMFVFGFIGLYAGIRYFHQKPFISVLTGYDKFRYKRLLFSFVIWGTLVALLTLVEYLMNPSNFHIQFNPGGFLISVLISFSLLPIQSGLEELLFRGYMLQGLSQIFKNGLVPLIITSLLFGLAHMGNPEVKEYGWPIMLAYFCCSAMFFGLLTLIDEGLELALGVHIANNIVSSLLVSDPHSVIKNYSLLESTSVNPPFELMVWFVMASITFVICWRKYGWKNFRLIIR